MAKNSTAFVQTFEKGIQIIEFLVEHRSVSVTVLSQYMGIQKSASFRFLNTLRLYGYVEQNERSNYFLTDKLEKLGKGIVPSMELHTIIAQFMDDLTKKNKRDSGVCNLGKWNGKDMAYILQTSLHKYADFQVGNTVPAYCSSLGKCVLAHLPSDALEMYLEKTECKAYTQRTHTSRSAILEQLDFVRENGFAVMDEELVLGLKSIAMPLVPEKGPVVYAISLSRGYFGSIDTLIDELLTPLRNTVQDIVSYMNLYNLKG